MPVLELERYLPTSIQSAEIATPQLVVVPEINTSELENDLDEVDKLQREFNRALGIDTDGEGIKNYNPVLARWRYEKLTTDEQRLQFREHETKQVETALRERHDSAESSLIYTIDENQRLRNSKIFPTEPFAQGIQRGVLYLRRQGSPDSEREEKEVEGFLKVERAMVNPETPINTKMMVISPPSRLNGSIYVKNFVDFYELAEVNGKRVVKMTRFASSASYGEATDAYLLSHPTRIDPDNRSVHDVFRDRFEGKKDALEENRMQEVLTGSKGRIRFFIDALCQGIADAESIAVALNAVLNGADLIKKGFNSFKEKIVLPVFRSIREEIDWLGRLPVEAIAAACGISGGFGIRGKGIKSISSIISTGFSSVNIEGADYQLGSCVVCKRGNVWIGGCSICTSCEENM
ncbi:MAG: hypothetical protein G01um10147_346 [Microgenomates group bacterium Gr01-1014_7]|nr:MAG: hypothetical protein G01um10147_346 [Microgenomates group bacterium Gr01-1014_7]